MRKWMRTVDNKVINLDQIVEIRAAYIREHNYTVVEAVATTGKVYFLEYFDGQAVNEAYSWIRQNTVT